MLSEAQKILSAILSPTSYDQFFDEIVGRKPLVQLGDPDGTKAKLAGDNPRQGLLNDFEKYAPTLTCHSHSPKTPPPNPRAVDSPEAFYNLIGEYFKLGYTVRIPDVLELSSDLSLFTRSLEKIIQTPVGVVVFWSAPGAAAPVHHDEVDVIVIQLEGSKKWFISEEPPTLPNKWKEAGESPPVMNQFKTVDVGPGDLLYLPRGTAHTVQSTSESIHLSIGFVPVTVRDALNATLDHFSDLNRLIRADIGHRSDSLSAQRDVDYLASQVRSHLEALLSASQQDDFIRDAMQRRRARMILDLPKLAPSPITEQLTIQSLVKHNPLALSEMIATDKNVDFSQPGDQILVHLGAQESMQFVKDTASFRIADIPGDIADDVRIALVHRLLSSGFLSLAE